MEEEADRPACNNIEQANESEEKLHVNARLFFDADLEQDDVESIEKGG